MSRDLLLGNNSSKRRVIAQHVPEIQQADGKYNTKAKGEKEEQHHTRRWFTVFLADLRTWWHRLSKLHRAENWTKRGEFDQDNLGVQDCVEKNAHLLQFCTLPLVVVKNSNQFSSQAKKQNLVHVFTLKPVVCICLSSDWWTKSVVCILSDWPKWLLSYWLLHWTTWCKSQSLTCEVYNKYCISWLTFDSRASNRKGKGGCQTLRWVYNFEKKIYSVMMKRSVFPR